ncbi:MAG: hypothetical protein ISS77_01380, partial [Phycisphaerae bacterium]|nr:hypothetical protein [Phycisphaerae bacterium]
RIEAKDIASRIWSVNVSDGSVKPGQQVDVTVVTEKYLGAKRKFEYRFKVPEDLKSGEYDLIVTGGRGYLDFLRQKAGARFVPDNINSLVGAIDEILGIGRDKLYCIFVLPPSGLWVERAELPDLPGTAAMVLADSKRTLRAQPWVGWKEKVFEVDGVVIDQKVLKIRVEEYGLLGIINKD